MEAAACVIMEHCDGGRSCWFGQNTDEHCLVVSGIHCCWQRRMNFVDEPSPDEIAYDQYCHCEDKDILVADSIYGDHDRMFSCHQEIHVSRQCVDDLSPRYDPLSLFLAANTINNKEEVYYSTIILSIRFDKAAKIKRFPIRFETFPIDDDKTEQNCEPRIVMLARLEAKTTILRHRSQIRIQMYVSRS
jgi:hypothetical protein